MIISTAAASALWNGRRTSATANKCTSIYKKKEKANLYNQLYEETKKEIRAKK